MRNLNILICEGNTPEEGKIFQDVGIPTHTESLKESLAYYNKDLTIDVLNPCLELNLHEIVPILFCRRLPIVLLLSNGTAGPVQSHPGCI